MNKISTYTVALPFSITLTLAVIFTAIVVAMNVF
jgi:hypothetical protein